MTKTNELTSLVQLFSREVEKLPVSEGYAKRWFRNSTDDISIEGRFIKNLKRKGYIID